MRRYGAEQKDGGESEQHEMNGERAIRELLVDDLVGDPKVDVTLRLIERGILQKFSEALELYGQWAL